MDLSLAIVGTLTVLSAAAAMFLRDLVRCALCLAVSLTGIAALFLQLDAPFAGFAQVLVYVGAVAILILFAVLLTRGTEVEPGASLLTRHWGVGLAVAFLTITTLVVAVAASPAMDQITPSMPADVQAQTGVKPLGRLLMSVYVVPLEVIGLLLTAAMLGAVVLAMREAPGNPKETP